MTSRTSQEPGTRLGRGFRRAAILTVTVTAAVVGAGTGAANASALGGGQIHGQQDAAGAKICTMATFSTEIQWGGAEAPWHADEDLTLLIANRHGVVTKGGVPVGTQVTWSGPNGNASIVFFGSGDFAGSAQFPNEGPVGYRGTLSSANPREYKAGGKLSCAAVAGFDTEIQWGGAEAPWHADEDLTLLIANRHGVVTKGGVPVGTQVTWSGPNGNASIVFFGSGDFAGSAQFPNEGPVGYRGAIG